MNKKDRKEIALINDILNEVNDRISDLTTGLEEKQANLEEYFPTMTEQLEDEIIALGYANEYVTDAVETLEEAVEVYKR